MGSRREFACFSHDLEYFAERFASHPATPGRCCHAIERRLGIQETLAVRWVVVAFDIMEEQPLQGQEPGVLHTYNKQSQHSSNKVQDQKQFSTECVEYAFMRGTGVGMGMIRVGSASYNTSKTMSTPTSRTNLDVVRQPIVRAKLRCAFAHTLRHFFGSVGGVSAVFVESVVSMDELVSENITGCN